MIEIYYLSAYVIFSNGNEVAACKPKNGIAHFYVQAENQPDAGAAAQYICAANGLEFLEYIHLPAPESKATLFNSPEHLIAFEQAMKTRGVVLLSVIMDGEKNCLDMQMK